ncbi:MAG TPA: RAMP superfamily CRISPR-associated protein [Candidatus Syntrophosphaera thermopropionivorans]|nr:RAMP superfamily CRISPR-associated protein [Candidatus Syntrophosphaera thermopropionivorans]
MKYGKIILKANLELISPLMIGSGESEISDRDILLNKEGKPFIPASSFMGKLYNELSSDKKKKYFGQKKAGENDKNEEENKAESSKFEHQSYIICDDLLLTQGTGKNTAIRDGIRINPETGLVEKETKFDYQVLEPGNHFALEMSINVEPDDNYNDCKELMKNIVNVLSNRQFALGGKTSSGFGNLQAQNIKVMEYDFADKKQAAAYLLKKETENLFSEYIEENPMLNDEFRINASFQIVNSFLIRSYSKTPYGSDATQIKCGDKFVLPGTSLRGALRARAQKILNLLWENKKDEVDMFIAALFGTTSLEKKNEYSVPSSLYVSETVIDNVKCEMQNRIQIDRFTGGTIESALFDSMPVFPVPNDEAQLVNLTLTIHKPLPSQKGLLLLLLKDLYTSELPIGGEKNVGRGLLKGTKATVTNGDQSIHFSNFEDIDEATQKLFNQYIEALISKSDNEAIEEYIAKFKKAKA